MLNINRILNIFYSKKGKFNKKTYIKFENKYYPNIKKYLDNIFSDSSSYLETLYRLKNNIQSKPICPICGNKIELTNKSHIYFPKTCSISCARKLSANKTKEKCLRLYGESNYAKLESVKNKYKKTCLVKYGQESYFQTNEFKEKSKKTCLNKYGVEHNLQIKEIHKKGTAKAQSEEIVKKRNMTIKEKYKVDNISQNIDIKNKKEKTFMNHYGVKNILQKNDIKIKANSKEACIKRFNTMKQNNSFVNSSYEDISYKILSKKFQNIIRQYYSTVYPFNCDFYIPDLDLYIECNYHWTHGGHAYSRENTEDNLILEKWKQKNTKYYNNAINTWTIRDVNKRNLAKKNKLNWIEFFSLTDLQKWINNYKK